MAGGLDADRVELAAVPSRPAERTGLLAWWHASDANAKRGLVAASLGWMVDMFDVQLYAMVLASLILHFDIANSTGGLIGSLTLFSSAIGGSSMPSSPPGAFGPRPVCTLFEMKVP